MFPHVMCDQTVDTFFDVTVSSCAVKPHAGFKRKKIQEPRIKSETLIKWREEDPN
jgi:hypothetical protein